MRRIPASKGFTLLVDDEDYERMNAYSWYAHSRGRKNGSVSYRPARRDSVPPRKVHFAHHEVMGKAPAGFVIDHINGDPFDNRRSNLRTATHGQNIRNQRRPRKKAGVGKGVHIAKGVLRVAITARGETFSFSGFENAREAELAYDALALFLHGEFASLNHPSAGTRAKSPEEVHAFLNSRRPEGRVLPFLSAGMTASKAAKLADVSITCACKIAAKHGIRLSRGRPKKRPTQSGRAA